MTNNLFKKLTESRRKVAQTLANPATIGLWNLIVDKYSGKAHFMYELLQNADDAGALSVRLVLKRDRFYFFHNGTRHFSVTDVDLEETDEKIGDINALCSIGHSTKVGENKIGKFGIGFKSIFSYCDVPHVEDDNFSFEIQNYIVPVETSRIEESGRREGETLFCGKLKGNGQQQGTAPTKSDEIAQMVASLEFPLNYLNNVISFECDVEGQIYTFTKTKTSETGQPQGIAPTKSEIHFYNLIAEKTVEDFTTSQKFICASTSISFESQQMSATLSMPIDGDGNLVMCDSSALNCFFPLLEQTTLPFIVHGTFLLSDNRENTLQNEENNALRHRIASLSVNFMQYLLSCNKDAISSNKDARSRVSTLSVMERLLEMKERCKYENTGSLNRLCSERLWQTITSEPFFANTKGDFLHASQLKFYVENVDEILNVNEIVDGNVCDYFAKTDFSKLPNLNKILEPYFWGIEDMLLSLPHVSTWGDEWWMRFYRFLYKERKILSKLLRGKSEAFTKPWIKCADGKFRGLKNGYSSQLYLNGETANSVNSALLEDKEIKSLFEDVFHLTNFTEQSLTVDFVAQQFHELSISPLDFDTLAKYIMIAANEYVGAGFDFEKKKSIVSLFTNLEFLPTNKYILSSPKLLLAETAAQRTFFADNADAVFLPNDFIEKHIAPSDRQTFYTFISACGVCFDVRVENSVVSHPIDYKLYGISDENLPSPSKVSETIIEDRILIGFDFFLQHPSLEKSLAFCRMLQKLLEKEVSTEVMSQITGKYRYIPKGKRNSVETILKQTTAFRQLFQSRWLVKSNGDFASVNEIPSTDLLMAAYDEIPCSVFSFLGITLKKRDENEEAREALELIRALEKVGITKEKLREMLNSK